mmetsp:Transcript_12940/g.27328  ORF Transcript_12940/g.27328 Transcript_12940/m.27328 type:complete len:236 (+) Transcript_12940:390-1097(+)
MRSALRTTPTMRALLTTTLVRELRVVELLVDGVLLERGGDDGGVQLLRGLVARMRRRRVRGEVVEEAPREALVQPRTHRHPPRRPLVVARAPHDVEPPQERQAPALGVLPLLRGPRRTLGHVLPRVTEQRPDERPPQHALHVPRLSGEALGHAVAVVRARRRPRVVQVHLPRERPVQEVVLQHAAVEGVGRPQVDVPDAVALRLAHGRPLREGLRAERAVVLARQLHLLRVRRAV